MPQTKETTMMLYDASTSHGFTNGNASLCIEQLLGQLCLNASCVVKK